VPAILNYLIHLLLAAGLLIVFFIIYTRVTPYNEVLLIRQGNQAAALSLGGALLGFSATIRLVPDAHGRLPRNSSPGFGAMVVQLLAYVVTTRLLRMSKDQIESNNSAFGGLLGAISLSIGAINAACIS